MSSSDSKRTRDQTSPTGYTPYTTSKRSTRETPRKRGEDESQDLQGSAIRSENLCFSNGERARKTARYVRVIALLILELNIKSSHVGRSLTIS